MYNIRGEMIKPVEPVHHIDMYDYDEPPEQPEKTITLTARELDTKLEMAKATKLREISKDLEAQGWQLARGSNGRYQIRPID